MLKLLFALVTAVTAVTASAAGCTPPNIIGMDYHLARAKLIHAGFLPDLTPLDRDKYGPMQDEPRRLGYAEVTDCSGTGYGGCWYSWTRKTESLSVYAREAFGEVRKVECK